MFSKLFSFILVYILSIFNFIIILFPLWLILIPMCFFGSKYIETKSIITIVLLVFFIVSCLMVLVMFFDFLFGFSVKGVVKGMKEYNKVKNYDILEKIFSEIKEQFNNKNVKLLISDSTEENAYAVGNMSRQYIVLTKGLVNLYLLELKKIEYFLIAMKCIIGHEMSHLINKDYLPGLLLETNRRAVNFVSTIVFSIFNILINIFNIIPIVGRIISNLIVQIYNLSNFIINFFYRYILLSIYKFIQLKLDREKEYRCDKQSSYANGGKLMSATLSVLGESGYSTIFSSHPKTQDRMAYVENIKRNQNIIIKPENGVFLVNMLSVLFIISLPLILIYYMDINGLILNYQDIKLNVLMHIQFLKMKFSSFF